MGIAPTTGGPGAALGSGRGLQGPHAHGYFLKVSFSLIVTSALSFTPCAWSEGPGSGHQIECSKDSYTSRRTVDLTGFPLLRVTRHTLRPSKRS